MNLPNKLTTSRLALTGMFLWVMFSRSPINDTLDLVFICFAAITDYLDGKIARSRNLITNFGVLMDPLADKVMIAAAFICLVPLKAIPAWVVIVIVSREFLITGLRLLAAGRGVVLQAERLGKHKALWQIVTAGYFLLLLALMEWERAGWVSLHVRQWWWPAWRYGGWTLAGVALVLTLYSGIGYLRKHRDLIAE